MEQDFSSEVHEIVFKYRLQLGTLYHDWLWLFHHSCWIPWMLGIHEGASMGTDTGKKMV